MSTLDFDAFWTWLQQHPNCLISAATPDASLYDDDTLHWFVGPDRSHLVVQLILGKRLIGEVLIDPERISYVQVHGEEREGEFVFEAIWEHASDRLAAYTFVLKHGLDDETEDAEPTHGPAVH
jgi:hypothetical protein